MSTEDTIELLLNQDSLYPECDRKSRDERHEDLVDWLHKYGEVNASYNLYGLDCVGGGV